MSSRHTLRDPLSRPTEPRSKNPTPVGPPELPDACGPMSDAVVAALSEAPGDRPFPSPDDVDGVDDPLTDRDFQLALWLLFELHHRGFAGVDAAYEWDAGALAARSALEGRFEAALRDLVEAVDPVPETAAEVVLELRKMTLTTREPALAAHLARDATEEQFREFLTARAIYHLREADAQCFLLGRLGGAAKVALAEIQYDELGAGRPDRLHADLFAGGLESLGLPTDLTSYVEATDAAQLVSVNTTSLFNLHGRLRGAAAGHFAAFEATSSVPCRLIAEGAERLGLPAPVAGYYLEHVEADAVHEQVAIHDLCGSLVEAEPDLAGDVLFGAAACLAVDDRAAESLLARWDLPADDEQAAS